ncbi:hypothetical protein ACL02T_27635 [Pseudonocardia sp. RS010]
MTTSTTSSAVVAIQRGFRWNDRPADLQALLHGRGTWTIAG